MPATSYYKKKVYAGQRGIEGLSWGVDDLTDVWARLDSAQGLDASIRSNTNYWDGAFRLGRPQDNFYQYILRSSMLDHDVQLYVPSVPATVNTEYFLFQHTPQALYNKTISPVTNNLVGVETFPEYGKSGKYQGSNFKGEGIMESLVHLDRPELKGDTNEGSFARYSTTSTANTQTGFVVPNEFLTMGKFDPVIKSKIRLPDYTVNTNRFFIGLISADTPLVNDTPFGNGDVALLLGFRNGDADFKMFRGVGNGTTTVPPTSSNIPITHSVFTIEFGFKNQGTVVYYKIGENGEEVSFANNLPNNDRWLKMHCSIQNSTVDQKELDVFYSRLYTKK